MEAFIAILVVAFVIILVLYRGKRRRPGGRRASLSKRDIGVVAESANSMVRVVNESLQIANSTGNPETKASRVRVAKETLERLKTLRETYPFLVLNELDAVELDIQRMECECQQRDYAAIADGNLKGQSLEKEGRIDEAIAVYERLASQNVDTPFTYRRLAILYRKQKDHNDEMRVLDMACQNIPCRNASHYEWFTERRKKLLAELGE